ncbi:MAG: UDP-N-acetylmuramoyl-tripeptide--D-alanyl-D-alanine ligase [Ignavibacteriae bacterium]|nr:UDP-N-acetylmuramoyl-tripeptide--D-alanyl-D-alanine ligase [Ignavibacteriota bacterium]
MTITLEDIFSIPTAVLYNPDLYKSVTSVSIDTRSLKKKSLYVAIKGKSFDGHNYIEEAVNKGASAVLISKRKLNSVTDLDIPIITVQNTKIAYGELAKIWRNKLNAKVISITGSNGKTSTKEITRQLLSTKFRVHSTLDNNNNDIGVPLTLLSTPKNAEVVVLEHGTNHFGEIEYTAKIAQPDVALITNIGNSHIEYLNNKKGVLKEKLELFNNVNPNGKVLINNDDVLLAEQKQIYKNKIVYGYSGRVAIKGYKKGFALDGNEKISVKYKQSNVDLTLPLLGESSTNNFLSALAICFELGLTKAQMISGSKKVQQISKRLEKKDFKKFVIIDDTYNSNPESVNNALTVLSKYKSKKNKIAILGDMGELGKDVVKFHKNIAKKINENGIKTVLSIGNNSKHLFSGLNKSVSIKKHFTQRNKMKEFINEMNLSDSIILVKGSRYMQMEEFVEILEKRAV